MKRLALVLLALGLAVPAGADVFVYTSAEKQAGYECYLDEWETSKGTEVGYLVTEQAGDKMNIWHVTTSKGKDKSGKMQKYVEADSQSQALDFIEASVGTKLIWIITFADDNDRGMLTGEAKPKKIGVEIPTVASTLAGLSIWDENDGSSRDIGTGDISLHLDTKMTSLVWGQDGTTATATVTNYLENKGYINCKANPCLCNGEWKVEPSMNIARNQFAGGVIDGKIYVFGGNGNPGGVNLKSTAVYDPATGPWTTRANNEHNGGEGVEELTSAVVDGKLYVFGAWGGIGPGGYYGDFNFNEMYNPANNTWTTLAEKPTVVTAAPATVYNGEIYLFGGSFNNENPSQSNIGYKLVEAYNPSTNIWRYVTDMPKIIFVMAVATIDTKAYLFGGADGGRSEPDFNLLDSVITYDFETGIWTTSGYKPLPVKKGFVYSGAAPVIDGKVYLIGGAEKVGSKTIASKRVDIYNSATNAWEKGPPLPKLWDDFVSVVIGQKIYVLGGSHTFSPDNDSIADVISLDTQPCSP